MEKNAATFSHVYSQLPNWSMIQSVETILKVMFGQSYLKKKLKEIEKGIGECAVILEPWRNLPSHSMMSRLLKFRKSHRSLGLDRPLPCTSLANRHRPNLRIKFDSLPSFIKFFFYVIQNGSEISKLGSPSLP